MPDIKMHRTHTLGLTKAREVAWQWAEQVEQEFGMQCTVVEGDDGDTVEFERSGVRGTLDVTADHFDLHARLGLLLGAFSGTIEREIEGRLDALLADGGKTGTKAGAQAGAKGAVAKTRATKAEPPARAAGAPAKAKKR